MRSCFLIFVCLVVIGNGGLVMGENEVKQGTYPFMALVHYSDTTKLEDGKRFTRNAVLISLQWLVSSYIRVNDSSTFPQKTLLARAGATTIDANLTLNEDENEQEREIIQVVYPTEMSETQWWHYDISLLKTLKPFISTLAVAPAILEVKPNDYTQKTCFAVIYGNKNPNSSDVRILMESPVEILQPEHCGSYLRKNMMICSKSSNEFTYDSTHCKTNKGGPLVHESKVIGLQTYVNDCQEPHLYQLLQAWMLFINCGKNEKCQTKQCENTCTAVDKDPVAVTIQTSSEDSRETVETFMLSAYPDRTNLMPDNVTTNPVVNEVREVSTPTTTDKTTRESTTTDDIDVTTKFIKTYTIATTTTTSTSTMSPTATEYVDVQPNTDETERNVEIQAKKLVDVPSKKNQASLTTSELLKILLASIFALFV